ncbi:MAG: hypothetical protein U9R51_00435 [Actinomycetota bacterium]|nr:hypothetical protein [Actinomycetota bacterium]
MDSRSHPDDALHGTETVSPVQPYQARKAYVCPGCESWIEPGVGHLVVVPRDAPDLRRHWHRGCWFKEQRRKHGSTDTG